MSKSNSVLEARFFSWSVGLRDAFGSFKDYKQTHEAVQYRMTDEEPLILELIELREGSRSIYIVASSLTTLFASENQKLALEVFYDFKQTYKQIEKMEVR